MDSVQNSIALNVTVVLEILCFVSFFYLVFYYVWPRFVSILDARAALVVNTIHEAAQAKRKLEDAHKKSKQILQEAQIESQTLLEQTQLAAQKKIAKERAAFAKEQQEKLAQFFALREKKVNEARLALQKEIGDIALNIAVKLLDEQAWGLNMLDEPSLQARLKELGPEKTL